MPHRNPVRPLETRTALPPNDTAVSKPTGQYTEFAESASENLYVDPDYVVDDYVTEGFE